MYVKSSTIDLIVTVTKIGIKIGNHKYVLKNILYLKRAS